MVSTPQHCWEEVKELATPHTQTALFGHFDSCWNILIGQLGRDSPPACPTVLREGDLVARHQPLGYFPNEYYLVALSPSFLAEQPQILQLVPVVDVVQPLVPDLVNQRFLDIFQLVNLALAGRTPELGAIVQVGLDQRFQEHHHEVSSSTTECP